MKVGPIYGDHTEVMSFRCNLETLEIIGGVLLQFTVDFSVEKILVSLLKKFATKYF